VSAEQTTWRPRRILIGYDGSDGAKDAVALCRILADPAGERALLVNVLPYPGPPSFVYRRLQGHELPLPDHFFEPAVTVLSGLQVETRAYVGASPARVLNDIAESGDFDLMVVGSPSRRRAGGALGSVAQALLHGAPIPIAVAPQGYAARDGGGKLARIAVAYDATEESEAALQQAAMLAQDSGAAIEVLNVERPIDPVGGPVAYKLDLPEDPRSILREARHRVDPSIEVDTRELRGTTAVALSEACRTGTDLLCLGSRGYGVAARVLLGSVSSRLLHEQPCPLLIAPRP
jgi:nucleotide-binding universal stress UspA family protein